MQLNYIRVFWLAIATLCSYQVEAKPRLRWCLDHFVGMHEFLPGHKVPSGPSVQMMQELAARSGFDLEVSGQTPSSRCFRELNNGSSDLMVNLLYSADKAQQIDLLKFGARWPDRIYLAAKDPRQLTQVAALNQMTLTTVRNYGVHAQIQPVLAALPKSQWVQAASALLALQMVAKGRVDAAILAPSQAKRIFALEPELASQIREVQFPLTIVKPQLVYLGFSRHSQYPQLRQVLQQQLQLMQQDGTLHRLLGDKMIFNQLPDEQ